MLPPSPPPTPSSPETVVLTLVASGIVSDYSDTSSLEQKIATAAGVDKSLVTISVAAASVIITANIAVPAAVTAISVQILISANLPSADAASKRLDITIVGMPLIEIIEITSSPPPSPAFSQAPR
jgi:hypothetical protein